jgi:hypothetical protein
MRTIVKNIGIILIIMFIIIFHILVKEFFSYPWNNTNILFLSMIWLIIVTGKGEILWLMLIPAFLMELFSSTLFGLQSFAFLFSLSILSLILLTVFTNYSIYIVFLSGIIGMFLYRTIFVLFYFLNTFFKLPLTYSLTTELFIDWGWETILTSLLLTVVYFISTRFIKKLKPNYIQTTKHPFYERLS